MERAAFLTASATEQTVRSVAFLGEDFPGLRIRAEVAQNDTVEVGQTLFRDRGRPKIAFVAPVSGRVSEIRFGPRRMLAAFVITADPDGAKTASVQPADNDAPGSRQALLDAGFWPAFIARPFGGPPDPDADPDAIFVTATASSANAPDPASVLAGRETEFATGIETLCCLTSGAVHICQGRGPRLWSGTSDRVHVSQFRSGGGRGLPGTHVHKLHPAQADRAIWTIGYQDVASIGSFVASGHYDPIRTVSIVRPGANSRMVQVPIGAELHAFFEDETKQHPGAARLISGSASHGRGAAYLGRYDDEATIARAPARRVFGFPLPIMPTAALDRAIPMNILTVPLMRALSIGDVQTCEKLGCLDLLEQDVAILSALCTSGEDYGARLREVLTQLKEQSA